MKRLVMISLLAVGTAFGAAGSASAAPTSTALSGLSSNHGGVVLAKDDRRGRHWRGGDHRRGNWHGDRRWRGGGDRYRGWHRYHSRPYGWRARGCVVVGPVWVCP
jgi:hypothetical protein